MAIGRLPATAITVYTCMCMRVYACASTLGIGRDCMWRAVFVCQTVLLSVVDIRLSSSGLRVSPETEW